MRPDTPNMTTKDSCLGYGGCQSGTIVKHQYKYICHNPTLPDLIGQGQHMTLIIPTGSRLKHSELMAVLSARVRVSAWREAGGPQGSMEPEERGKA